jgi:hypothetical protein
LELFSAIIDGLSIGFVNDQITTLANKLKYIEMS